MTVTLDVGHEDLVHDVAFDFYGQRMATCASDQAVKVWDLDAGGDWRRTGEFKAHDASVLRVAWAHPEFGQVLATCSVDRTVRIWEEQQQEAPESSARWTESARLVESRGSIQDIKFAPKHLGLRLAACSADGFVRIYEAMDVMNLARWSMMDEFEVYPNAREPTGGFCLSWCSSRFHPALLVVGCGKDAPKIFKYEESARRWRAITTLPVPTGVVVHDLAWAPNIGRDYHLIAAACKDKHVRIFRLRGQADKFAVDVVADADDHKAEVWRVQWNVTGTVLSSSGDDGQVRLWKADFNGKWVCNTEIVAGGAAAVSTPAISAVRA